MKLRQRCMCGAWILWARDSAYDLVEVNPQAELDRSAPGAVVLWWESGAGDRVQRVSTLAEFAATSGAVYVGPVWQLHSATCTRADQPLGWVVSARGRRLLRILEEKKPRTKNGGSAR